MGTLLNVNTNSAGSAAGTLAGDAKSSKSVSFTKYADTRMFNRRKLASVIALRNHEPTIFKRHNVRRDGEASRRRAPRYSMSASRNPEVQ